MLLAMGASIVLVNVGNQTSSEDHYVVTLPQGGVHKLQVKVLFVRQRHGVCEKQGLGLVSAWRDLHRQYRDDFFYN